MKEGRHCHLVKRSLDGGSMIELQEWVGWRVECILENECASRMIWGRCKRRPRILDYFSGKKVPWERTEKGAESPDNKQTCYDLFDDDLSKFWRDNDALSHCPMSISYPQIGCGLCQNRIVGADDDIETIRKLMDGLRRWNVRRGRSMRRVYW